MEPDNHIPMVINDPSMAIDDSEVPSATTGRPRRTRRLPARFRDTLPTPPAPALSPDPTPDLQSIGSQIKRVTLIVRDRLVTVANVFGIWRDYPRRPSYDPDTIVRPDELSNQRDISNSATNLTPPSSSFQMPPWPFANMSIWRLMTWLNSGSATKTEAEVNRLAKEIRDAGGFQAADLEGFNAHRENKRLDAAQESPLFGDGFQETSIPIRVPTGDPTPKQRSKTYNIPGLYFRKLTSVIKSAFEGPLAEHMHFFPYKLLHKSPVTGEDERIFCEVYDSNAFAEVHEDVQRHGHLPPDDPGCKREKVVAALMFWSDSTHLTDFGTAKIWPIYLLFGNISKYIRMRPTSGACHHLAYIPSVRTFFRPASLGLTVHFQLPDAFHDWVSENHVNWKTQKKDILAHCRRELMHAVWKHVFDSDFIHAMEYGIVIRCSDGVERRVYPRIFTYSADYPEK